MNAVPDPTMRIALFTDSFYPELGGIQDSIMATAREFGARGHRVMIFAPAAAPEDFERANLPLGEPKLGEHVRVHRLFSVPVPGSTGQSRLVFPTLQRWRTLSRFDADLIHSHTFLGTGLEALAVSRQLGLPLVGTNHWAIGGFSLYAPMAREAVARGCWRSVVGYYNRCDWVSAPSRATFAEMAQHGFRKPGGVISNPIDTELFRPPRAGERRALKARLGLSDATVVYAGRLAREKRIEVLLRALPALCQRVPTAALVLAGHGTAREALEGLARELGVADRVRFTGTLSHGALAELFRAADVFALASTSESQSMVLLQAMSAGLPVVGARHGPLVDSITPDVGVLAEPEQPDAFAEALAPLLKNATRRAVMGERARQATAGFAVRAVADAWLDVYTNTCRGDTIASAAGWS
jgi:glycosyltransferase involved in cell wall biosynthesis